MKWITLEDGKENENYAIGDIHSHDSIGDHSKKTLRGYSKIEAKHRQTDHHKTCEIKYLIKVIYLLRVK